MRTTASALVGILLIATPAASHERPGAFVGARLQLPLGGQHSRQPRAALAAAPTHSRMSDRGMVQTRIGEGIALNLTPGARPTLTLAGVRADSTLGLRQQGQAGADDKLRISTGGWIAIGVGTVALAVGGLALWDDPIMDCEERENGC